jgi:membrane-bound ClpP family serine protease
VHGTGTVLIKGEYWNATSDKRVEAGRVIKVVKVEGLKIKVEEIENKQGG